MGRALSQDLRDWVIEAVLGGMSARSAGARFGIGASTALAWAARARTGDNSARFRGNRGGSKLDAHLDFLLPLIEGKSDITLAEMQARLAEERHVKADIGTIWAFLDRHGQTFKKRVRTHPSRTGPTS
jgi:transposase